MFTAIKNRLVTLLQLILVMVYVIFEELIWEKVAKPIYESIHSLKILQKVESKLKTVKPSVILVIFIVLLGLVEAFGVYAGVLFVRGKIFLGLVLYISKVPIAAFTFWLFRVTEDKLMQFRRFKWLYEWMMSGIAWLKSRDIYINTMKKLKELKEAVKKYIQLFKKKFFIKESLFLSKIKSLYKTMKASLKNK